MHLTGKEYQMLELLALREGKLIEWRIARLAHGKSHAFATILRWHVTKSDVTGNPVLGQVHVVTRLGPGGVCHVGYVDGRANPNANVLAQQIADENAREFKCGKDKPIILGTRGKTTSVDGRSFAISVTPWAPPPW